MRRKIPPDIEEQVLTASRRRCAMCYGLNRDKEIKRGQIAHLDRDNSSNDTTNLVFLCLLHHEEYDATSRQAKGFTPTELRKYRQELYDNIGEEWKRSAPFAISGGVDLVATKAGHYVLEGPQFSAELQLAYLGNNLMQVSGLAVWEGASSAHTGSVDFVAEVRKGDCLYFADQMGEDWYNLGLRLGDGTLIAQESSNSGYHGMNVSFAGTYRRA